MTSDMAKFPLVLAYHRVHPHPSGDSLVTTPAQLRAHILTLQRLGYDFVTVAEWYHNSSAAERKLAILTFDDGWMDNYEFAFNILKQCKVSATIYLISGYLGAETVPATMSPLPGRRFLTRDQIVEMRDAGIDFGSHTKTHPVLPSLEQSDLEDELCQSKALLEDMLGNEVISICYPKSQADERVLHAARSCGYRVGMLTRSFKKSQAVAPGIMALPRVGIYSGDGIVRLLAKLALRSK